MMQHPPYILQHPISYRGDVARQLTLADLGSPEVERAIGKAARIRNSRRSMVAMVMATTGCPFSLIDALHFDDLIAAGEWATSAFEREVDARIARIQEGAC